MKLLWNITKEMYHSNTKTFITPELEKYTLPYEGKFLSVDVGRLIFLNDAGLVVLESFRNKKLRETKEYLFEKEENRPIINNTEQ